MMNVWEKLSYYPMKNKQNTKKNRQSTALKDDKGRFYEKAYEHCLSIGYDTAEYCGEKDGVSYYYLSNSKRAPVTMDGM